MQKVWQVLKSLNLWILLLGLIMYWISQLIFVLRWQVLLKAQSIQIGYWPTVRLHLLGLFYNNCLPSSVGGDLLRAWYVTKHTDKKFEAAISVFVDRAIGLLGLVLMAFVGFCFLPKQGTKQLVDFANNLHLTDKLYAARWYFLAFSAAVILILTAILIIPRTRTAFLHFFSALKQKLSLVFLKLRKAVIVYWGKKTALLIALMLTFLCQGIFITALVLIGKNIHLGAPVRYYYIFIPISWVLGTLPISPGGVGVVEGVLRLLFSQVSGVLQENAIALALCQRLLWLLGSLPGAVIHMMGVHLPKDFSIDYKDDNG